MKSQLLIFVSLLSLSCTAGCTPTQPDPIPSTQSASGQLVGLFQQYVQRNNIPPGQQQYNDSSYISGRANLYCSLLASQNYTKMLQEVSFPPVGNMLQNSSNSSRLEILIIDAAVQTTCTEQQNSWMRARQNFAR